ncbi:glyoxalase [Microbacterium sp. ARD32]|uniref:VOC family protein n=1 Tax=Microbacterium sp. ARD32 TaxID=2962577 RepID=UPI002880F2C0|nr:VOC family protein [Microbacterium sp. ARD32]MDT0158778.1 glyoxalase [Microbacterium sp. ARD32]
MRVDRVVPNLTVTHLRQAVAEHSEALDLRILMDHGWIVTLGDEDGHQLSLMTRDASAPVNPDVSVFVDDVRAALARAEALGLEIVHPLTEEPWGVTRFFYRASDGRVINVGMHTEPRRSPLR